MSIFGQVWLWSLAAFFAGALVTVGAVVRPLRKNVRNLENALAQAHADAARTPANVGSPAMSGTSGMSQMTAPPMDAEGTEIFSRPEPQPLSSHPGSFGSGTPAGHGDLHDDIDEDFAELDAQVPVRSFEPEPVAEPETYEPAPVTEPVAELGDPYRAAATQYLTPVGSTSAELDEPYRAATPDYQLPTETLETFGQIEEAEKAEEPADGLFDPVVEHEPESDASVPALSRPEPRLDGDAGALFAPSAEPHSPEPDWFDHEPVAERSAFEEPDQRTQYIGTHPGSVKAKAEPEPEPAEESAFGEDESSTGGLLELDELPETPETPEVPEETPVESTQVLPKRQPRESPRGGFDPPRPIQPSMRAVERRDPDLTGAHSGSLFEPSVPPNQVAAALAAPEPPPAPPARQAAADAVPPGPFGPGSAMPRPGGGRPGDGFAVKASVTALRYCTDESAQFPRMVAEVWFRTAEDAERVGFRPLT